MKNLLIIGVILVVVGGGAYLLLGQQREQSLSLESSPLPAVVKEGASAAEKKAGELTRFALSDVAEHNTADDCWLALSGKVYDVTEFIASGQHPGGEAILQGCGSDATQLYETRPMGSKTPHSERARSLLSNYEIGELEK